MILKVNLGTDRSPDWVDLQVTDAKTLSGLTIQQLIERTKETIAPIIYQEIQESLMEEITMTVMNEFDQRVTTTVTNILTDDTTKKEVTQARGTYSTLKQRLDAMQIKINAFEEALASGGGSTPTEDITTIDGGTYNASGVVEGVDGEYDGGVYGANGEVQGVTDITDGGQV